MKRLAVDWTACEGRGLCSELLPELLVEDPWGFPASRTTPVPGALADVPTALEPTARQAVHLCPRLALRLLP